MKRFGGHAQPAPDLEGPVSDSAHKTVMAAEQGEGFMDLTNPCFPQHHRFYGGASNFHFSAFWSQFSQFMETEE
jgi:hypothetical protein